MFTEKETDLIIEKSKGRLKPTPYYVDGELLSYSARRTSKVKICFRRKRMFKLGIFYQRLKKRFLKRSQNPDPSVKPFPIKNVVQLVYLSEKSSSLMKALSERVELATQFNLTHSRLDSENYQVRLTALLPHLPPPCCSDHELRCGRPH